MFRITKNTIELTRGDTASINLKINDYEFGEGDKVEFRVYTRKGMNSLPVLSKIINVDETRESVDILLTSEDTTFGEMENKPITYWYEIELNDKYTIIGYDNNGPKELILYPEGDELNGNE